MPLGYSLFTKVDEVRHVYLQISQVAWMLIWIFLDGGVINYGQCKKQDASSRFQLSAKITVES